MILELEGSENGMSSSMGGGITWVMRKDSQIKWRLASGIRSLNRRCIHVAQKKKKDKEAVKGKVGNVWLVNSDSDDWRELEDQCIDLCQSSYDSSSDNSESDKEALEVEEVNTVNIKEAAEEVGFEELRSLLDSQVIESEGQKTNEGEMVERSEDVGQPVGPNEDWKKCLLESQVMEMDGQPTNEGEKVETSDDLGQGVKGYIPDELRSKIKIGKIGISWQEIKDTMGSLNIELIEKEANKVNKTVEEKDGRSAVRRRWGDRELHNLKCNINYDKERMEKGLNSDT